MFSFPLKDPCKITQKFGNLDFGELGAHFYGTTMDGRIRPHDGLDYAIDMGKPVYAPFNGIVASITEAGYGNCCRLVGEGYDCIMGHFLTTSVKVGQEVKAGEVVGLADSTGNSTGSHLHLGIRRVIPVEKNNGEADVRTYAGTNYKILDWDDYLFGYIDPAPFFVETEILPVDLRYGQPYSLSLEVYWSLKYKEAEVQQRAINAGFSKYEIPKMRNAFIYGKWPDWFVFAPANFQVWSQIHLPEFEKRIGHKLIKL